MAKMIQVPYEYSISVPVETAQAVQENRENPISLEALGLLVNLLSYPTNWELYKTELYKRFAKHGERSVRTAWKDLMNANYIVEFKYRVGSKYEYVYYFRKVPFTDEEKAEILANAEKEFGEIWGLQNEDPTAETSKRRDNKKTLLNKNNILNTNNNYIDNIDDDKRTKSSSNHNEENIHLTISHLRNATEKELTDRSFNAVVRKVVDKYNQGKIDRFRDYLVTALANKIEELELRRMKDDAKQALYQSKKQQTEDRLRNTEYTRIVPFYNWLKE
ncbi:hypothetical protein [Metabacillus fastidiosus]|uniref:hypothetical protein n=1 Tax=Metabacillus fastidiosus TaxID=1458 RepID=UPI002DBE2B2B|nr:hypothetical protein [Metabacillus fastidiosus]MEC2075858.1 hypothetical protein [Metabacillus fastidiosus]